MTRGIAERYRNATVPDNLSSVATEVYEGKSVFIFGAIGTGKTYLAAALVMELAKRRKHSWLFPIAATLAEARAEIDKNTHKTITELCRVQVAAIDDLGMEKPTEWTKETMDIVIDHRYANMMQTIFTSNMSIDDVTTFYSSRVSSRITEMCMFVNLSGKDRRTK